MKRILLSFIILVFFQILMSQNPSVVNGVATYTANMNIGRKFPVPDEWNKIVINENVTITGSFYMATRNHPIEIMGKDRKTSIIQGDGSRPTDDGIKGRTYSAIRCDKSPDLYVHDLTITRPMKFHIHGGFGNVTVERCDIIAGSDTHTTDGIHGGLGKTIVRDCYIDVYDDALYTIECKLVENTTIVHNLNGGPFMTSWGSSVPNNHICVVRNCTVIANSNNGYNHGVFSWSQKSDDKAQTMHVKIEGTFDYIINPGKQAAPMYTIGRPRDLTGLKNATLLIDGMCLRSNSIIIRENPESNKVVFVNCNNCTDNTAPSVPGLITTSNVGFNKVDVSWGASTDDVAVAGYEVYVNGLFNAVSTTTSISISGLNCNSQYTISVLAYDECGNKSAQNNAVVFSTSICPPCVNPPTISGGNGPEEGQSAYFTTTLPATILAENVDNGANAVAYFDNGYGGTIRTDRPIWSTEHGFRLDSDIEFDVEDGNTFIGGINPGEWAEYTVNVPSGGGTYRLSSVKYSTNNNVNAKVWFKIASFTSCLFTLPNTNRVWNNAPVDFEFTLPEGEHVFTWVSEAFGFNLDEFVIENYTPSAVNASSFSNKLTVYPNPAKAIVNVETISEKIYVLDISGRIIDINIDKTANGFKLNVENLNAGIYFIKDKKTVAKFFKE